MLRRKLGKMLGKISVNTENAASLEFRHRQFCKSRNIIVTLTDDVRDQTRFKNSAIPGMFHKICI